VQEAVNDIWISLRANPIIYLVIALVAGIGACKTVMLAWRLNLIFFLVIGLVGLFLGQLLLITYGKPYIEPLPQFRLLFDLLAAYLGSFVVASLIYFIKPL